LDLLRNCYTHFFLIHVYHLFRITNPNDQNTERDESIWSLMRRSLWHVRGDLAQNAFEIIEYYREHYKPPGGYYHPSGVIPHKPYPDIVTVPYWLSGGEMSEGSRRPFKPSFLHMMAWISDMDPAKLNETVADFDFNCPLKCSPTNSGFKEMQIFSIFNDKKEVISAIKQRYHDNWIEDALVGSSHVLFDILGEKKDELAFEKDNPPNWWFYSDDGINYAGITYLKGLLSFLHQHDSRITAMSKATAADIVDARKYLRKILQQESVQQLLQEHFPQYSPQ